MREIVAAIVAALLGLPAGALAQDLAKATNDPESVRAYAETLGVGAMVRVTLTDGSRVSGTLAQVTPPRKDSLRNGALIGLVSGVIGGAVFGWLYADIAEASSARGSVLKFAALFGGAGAAAGAGIDAMMERTDLFPLGNGPLVPLTPVVGRRQQGVRLSIRF